MNSSEIVKNELYKYHENEIIFASKFYKEKIYKKNVSETSFYKILERMYKNKEIEKLSKGIYYFPKETKFGVIPISDEEIISIFTKNNEGMVVGYNLYNRLNLTTQISKKITIYSSNVGNDIKNIRNIEIRNVKTKYSNEYKKIIEMLEVLQNFCEIQDLNYIEFYKYVEEFAMKYNERKTVFILEKMNYKKSTISFLNHILNYFKVDNTLNKYLSSLSKYKHILMEEIYEFTRTQERF